MPGTVSDAPTVSLSFANNFWGKEDAGVSPLLDRMHNAKTTSDELKAFYSARAAIEEEYSRKLLNIARKPLGSSESGTLRMSLDVVKAEIDSIGKAHQNVAQQMKSELDEQLAAFAGGMKERRKIVQGGIEKLLKTKTQQTMALNKAKDRYEQDCLKIKGYLAQGHMVMGQEERKNKAKLEKTQLQLSTTNNEYESAVKILEETTGRWNREWKAACDKFQDFEEERIDFTKSSLWSFANIASTVCVSDDASCEKIRLSLEDCDVEKDISNFIKDSGTGQEIPEAPKYVNFCRGDAETASQASDDENYSVAQFQRTMNPAYRTSSPQPSTFESHHEQDEDLVDDYRHAEGARSDISAGTTPRKPQQQQYSRPPSRHQQAHELVHKDDYPEVPHNDYPMDGMTQFCRLGAPSEVSSAASPQRPSSRDSQSEYSNPTSFSSVDPGSVLSQSPTKGMTGMGSDLSMTSEPAAPGQDTAMKKRSGLFQGRSPFRRKSKSEKESPKKGVTPSTRTTWSPANGASTGARHVHYGQPPRDQPSPSPEPVDPRANFQLNVGQNVFDVASPDVRHKPQPKQQISNGEPLDPIAQALADLKGANLSKAASTRQSADRYAGLATPAPGAVGNRASGSPQKLADRSAPPPSYPGDGAVSRLGAPQPAFTSRQMQQTTQSYVNKGKEVFNSPSRQAQPNSSSQSPYDRPRSRQGNTPSRQGTYEATSTPSRTTPQSRPGTSGAPNNAPMPRATSPSPYRSTSPRPGMYNNQGSAFGPPRATSPNPAFNQAQGQQQGHGRSQSSSPMKGGQYGNYDQMPRATSPRPGFGAAGGGSEMVLAQPQQQQQQQQPGQQQQGSWNSRARGGPAGGQRPVSGYGHPAQQQQQQQPMQQQDGRARSRSQAPPATGAPRQGSGQFSRDGRPVLHFSRALYTYTAQIPEELSFTKGDVVAVLRHQDDGWWEAELTKRAVRPGLIPSNYMGAI